MSENDIRDRLVAEEYEIQHFGFSSSYFIAEYQNAINYTIKYIHDEMEKSIIKNLGLTDEEKEVLRLEIDMLTESYSKETEKCIKKYEKQLRDIFYIPPNVLLESDNIHEENKDVNLEQLEKEIDDLKREYLKEKSLCFLYESEINRINQTAKLQDQISKLIEQTDKMSDSNSTITQFYKLHNLYKDIQQRFEEEFDFNLKKIRSTNNLNS